MDNRILFLQKCLLNSSPQFIRLLLELLNLIGCRDKIKSLFSKKVCFSRTISRLKVTYMLMTLATSLCFLAHLSRRLIGELIVDPWSGVRRRPSVVVRRPQCSNIFFSETARPIKAKFYVEPPWVGGMKF